MNLSPTRKRNLIIVGVVLASAYFFVVLFSYMGLQTSSSVAGNALANTSVTPTKTNRTLTPTVKPSSSPTRTATRSPIPSFTASLMITTSPTATATRTATLTPIVPTATLTKTNTTTPLASLTKTSTLTPTMALTSTATIVAPSPTKPITNAPATNTATMIATATTPPSPTPTATATTRLTRIEFNRALKGMSVSDHSVAPSTRVEVQIGFSTTTALTGATLSDYIPRTWSVIDTGGGTANTLNADTQKIDWALGDISAGAFITKTYTLTSPARAIPAPQYAFSSVVTMGNAKWQSAAWQVLLEHPLAVRHYRIGQNAPLNQIAFLAATDAPGRGLQQFVSFRVRFLIANDQLTPVNWKPRLEWSARADNGFQIVPLKSTAGQPFYLRAIDGIQNRQTIPASQFALSSVARVPQSGMILTGENPGPSIALNAVASTEIEFSVHTTMDAAYSTNYYFRLSDDDRQMPGLVAQIEMGAPMPLQLTQPQYAGIDANSNTTTSVNRLTARAAIAGTSPHGSYSNLADQCASCHRQHTARNRNLLAFQSAQSNLCFACHNGTGASTNIQSQYSDPNVPANNATTSSFYSHPATTATNHTNAINDEFKGVLNRHSECSDCHNPHSGDSTLATSTATGFTVSGALKNITGVSASLSWKPVSTFSYELCLKCHSSYTTLLAYTKPSYKMLDQAAEFNPANASFHPLESAGKNSTAAMAASLAGTSPYKLWNFTVGSVIRCENCHGDYRLANPASPPAANARLAPHTSKFANVLMNNYRDRLLKPAGQNYAAADFALCYQCHAEAPFAPGGGSSTATNFRLHSYHLTNIGGNSNASTDIDTPGAGQGRAICAECHYRVHGQSINATGNPSGTRLVNFAPNITAVNGQLKWDPATRTCTLVCHGDTHNPERY